MISITAHLLDYTLECHCGGKKSVLARKMNVRRTDFNRIYDRCTSGAGGSLTALEALLRYYFTDKLSLDEALAGYRGEISAEALREEVQQECRLKPQQFHERLTEGSRLADQKANVLRSAEQLMRQLERALCQNGCSPQGLCKEVCPCQQLCELVERVTMLLDASSNMLQRSAGTEVNSYAARG